MRKQHVPRRIPPNIPPRAASSATTASRYAALCSERALAVRLKAIPAIGGFGILAMPTLVHEQPTLLLNIEKAKVVVTTT